MKTSIALEELPSLDEYLRIRDDWRSELMQTKRNRLVAVGDNVSLLFESYETVKYQILEMLRIEKTTDPAAIKEELDAYNPLIPDGSNWKATMMIEYPDEQERRVQLKYLRGVEDLVWCSVDGQKVYAIADEDMERSDDEKTSAVHFLRFQLTPEMISAATDRGAAIQFGIDHERYHFKSAEIQGESRDSLVADLNEHITHRH